MVAAGPHFDLVVLVHVVVAARVRDDLDARALEQLALLAEDVVLPADRRGAVEIMDHQHFADVAAHGTRRQDDRRNRVGHGCTAGPPRLAQRGPGREREAVRELLDPAP